MLFLGKTGLFGGSRFVSARAKNPGRGGLFFLFFWAAAPVCGAAGPAAAAAPAAPPHESASRDYLIERLRSLHESLPDSHFSKKPVALRLAHILSLRAEETLAGAGQSLRRGGARDARQALAIYSHLSPHIKKRHPSLYIRSLFEMARLHQLTGEKARAIPLLKEAARGSGAGGDLALRAWFNIGELRLELGQHESALAAYEKILKRGDSPWAFRASYRRIWRLYNLSRHEESIDALESFLKSPLYARGASSKEEKETKARLQGELTALYSRGEVTGRRLRFLYSFIKDSPEENSAAARRGRLAALAESLSQIGRAAPSTKAWRFFLEKAVSPEEKMQACISMIKNDFVLGEETVLREAEEKVKALFAAQRQLPPAHKSGALRGEAKKAQKAYIKTKEARRLALKEAKAQSGAESLFSLYTDYNALYPGEFDMLTGAAFAAKALKKFAAAARLAQKAALAPLAPAAEDEKKAAAAIAAGKAAREKAAVFQMEMAALSKDPASRASALRFYIRHGADKTVLFKAKYQLAWLLYEGKSYKEAVRLLEALALRPSAPPSPETEGLRLKAARLFLAALSARKTGETDRLMADAAARLQKIFPGQRREFAQIRHTALLNMAESLAAGKQLSPYPAEASKNKNILRAYQTLGLIDESLASKEDLKKSLANRLLLAKELLRLDEAGQIISRLLAMPSLTARQRRETLKSRLWLAEARFDFKEILRLARLTKPAGGSESRLLQLALLAELAGEDFLSYYQDFLAKHPRSEKSLFVVELMAERAREKSRKADLLRQNGSYFSDRPEALSRWAMKLDEGRLDQKFISRFVDPWPFMKSTYAARFLKRKRFMEFFLPVLSEARGFSLPAAVSERQLAASLKAYSRLLDRLEAAAAKAVEMEDWLSQAVAFSRVYEETARFCQSVLALPAPKDLTSEEKSEYLRLVRVRMAPCRERAARLRAESERLWSRQFTDQYKNSRAGKGQAYQAALNWELDQLSAIAPEKGAALRGALAPAAKKAPPPPPAAAFDREVRQAMARLKAAPFSESRMKGLLRLEERRQNWPMSSYLKGRIAQISQIRREAL